MADNNENESLLEKKSSRREFLRNSGIAVGGILVGGGIGGLLLGKKQNNDTDNQSVDHQHTTTTPHADYSESLHFFRRRTDFNVLSAAVECIFPENKLGPGAIALGVPYFIDKQLASPFGTNSGEYMKAPFLQAGQGQVPHPSMRNGDMFINGLRKLNEVSMEEYNKNFDSLEREHQNTLLTKFQKGEVQVGNVNSAMFFAKMRALTLEGLFSDPMYGGNKDMQGWKMKEFPGAVMSYINEVEEEFKVMSPISVAGHKH